MTEVIQSINLDNQEIQNFFEKAFQSGTEIKDCNAYLSQLLERCSQEKCLDSMFPVISSVAQRIQDVLADRMPKNNTVPSIH